MVDVPKKIYCEFKVAKQICILGEQMYYSTPGFSTVATYVNLILRCFLFQRGVTMPRLNA